MTTPEQEHNYLQYVTNMIIDYYQDSRNMSGVYMSDMVNSSSPVFQEISQFVYELFGKRHNISLVCMYSEKSGLLVDDWFGALNPIYIIKLRTCRERWISAIKDELPHIREKRLDWKTRKG